ncbi:DHA2 family efflux MFS transporter permease subunit [Planotetraspora sp. A-T 1434]|uniref:DHA2 family efflux MFS transporter permease subunit n=1 Tax=Planotetraspora sp. A-T 1434 TaxID=2979219 RepID=UPI0021C0E04F|nr:DHA2 family efflux MFS transporter permease subunit [Planotetraspora sp. A-T 1434]MCT9929113.1 DHA2 family efflux MFS transporter permease subunit [Planotetraspora sp. A-T 1434]
MAQAVAVQPDAHAGRSQGNPWLTLLAVSLGVIMVMLDGTVVAIANPVIGVELHASLSDLQWITSGYLLALAVFLITAGKLGDLFGHKKVFLIGVTGFALTSLAIGLTSSVGPLIAFRVLQGLFGALLQPAALALLRSAFPGDKLNMAMGAWGGIIGLSSAAGPIIGGLLVENVSWQSVFFINVPVGVAALAFGLWALKESKAQILSKVDWLGVLLLSGAMFSLVWAIIKAPEWGWGDKATIGFLIAAAVIGAVFLFWQTRVAEPLLPLSLFRNASLSIGTVLMILMAFSMFGAMFFLTFFFQGVHGLTPLESGLRMLPMSAGMIVASPIAGVLIGKIGPKITIAGGMLITAIAMFLMSRLGVDAAFVDSAIPFVLLAFGLSPVFVGATEIIVGNAPEDLSGVAGGVQNSAMQVGGALGTAILGAVVAAKVSSVLPGYLGPAAATIPPAQLEGLKTLASVGMAPPGLTGQTAALIGNASHLSFMDGLHLGFLVSTAVAVIAAILALFVKAGRKTEGAPVHVG